MNKVELEFTPEQQQELREKIDVAVQAFYDVFDAIVQACKIVLERMREIALNLARFFLKSQLLEWKIPYRIADFISKNTPWEWAWWIGFNWFRRKYSLSIE